MIFLTVGTFPPGFDRLVEAVDKLCEQYMVECTAQISNGSYTPRYITSKPFFSAEEQFACIKDCRFVIAHGGFGVIGDILRQGKPLLVFPRKPEEGPNDQRPVAKRLAEQFDFHLCNELDDLERVFLLMLNASIALRPFSFKSNVPTIIRDYLGTI